MRLDPGYVQFSIQDGTEIATLSAQDFRIAMRERDALRVENEQLKQDNAELSAECDQWGEKVAECWREIEGLRTGLTEIMQGARSVDYAIHVARVALGSS